MKIGLQKGLFIENGRKGSQIFHILSEKMKFLTF